MSLLLNVTTIFNGSVSHDVTDLVTLTTSNGEVLEIDARTVIARSEGRVQLTVEWINCDSILLTKKVITVTVDLPDAEGVTLNVIEPRLTASDAVRQAGVPMQTTVTVFVNYTNGAPAVDYTEIPSERSE